MRLLAIDPGSRQFGWAIFDTEQPTAWGVVSCEKIAYHNRFAFINQSLNRILYHHMGIEECACEQAIRWRGKKVPELEVAVHTVKLWASRALPPYMTRFYHPATWKSSITGSSSADKETVARVIYLHFPYLPDDLSDHITDAIGIGIHHFGVRRIEDLAREAIEKRI